MMVRSWPAMERTLEFMRRRVAFKVELSSQNSIVRVHNLVEHGRELLEVKMDQPKVMETLVSKHGPLTGKAASYSFGKMVGKACHSKGVKRMWLYPPISFPRSGIVVNARARLSSILTGMHDSGVVIEVNPHHLLNSRALRGKEPISVFWRSYLTPLQVDGILLTETPADIEPTYEVITADEDYDDSDVDQGLVGDYRAIEVNKAQSGNIEHPPPDEWAPDVVNRDS